MRVSDLVVCQFAQPGRGSRRLAAWLILAVASPVIFAADPAPPASVSQPPTPARASSSAAKPTPLGEVVVTANRRRQPSREVPMHVDSTSAQRLRDVGAKNLSDYVSYQPGVFFASQGGPGQGTLIMRGVSTGNQTSPTVAVYVDGVPIGGSTVYSASASHVFDAAMMDLDHVEFLFGPQGTLYGAGSMGGLVKYVTQKPDTDHFEGSVGLDISQTRRAGIHHTVRGMLNIPLSRTGSAALRVSAVNRYGGGVYRAVGETPDTHADSSHTRGARAQLQLYPGSRLSIRLTAMAQQIDADGLSMADDDQKTGRPISGGPFNRRLNHREPFKQTLQLYSLHAGYDLDWGSLEWISAYQTFTNRGVQDYPDRFLTLLNQLGPLFGVNQKLDSLYVDSGYTVHKASQEIRLTSRHNDRVDWLAGVWFSREDNGHNFVLQGENRPPPGITPLLHQVVSSRFQEYAGYGDATWHLTPVIDLTLGARLSGNTQTLSNFEDGAVAGSPGGFREHRVGHDVTQLLTASYRPDKTHSYYVRAATGYRPGGLQAPVTSTIFGANDQVTDSFGSDTLASYEFGYKGNFTDHDLSVGADVYDIEWHNLQVPTYTVGNAVIVNLGDARINGLEFQTSFTPGHWQIQGSAAWAYGRMVDSRPGSGIAVGAPLPYSARLNFTLRARRKFRLLGEAAHVGASLRASSHRHAGFENNASDPDFDLPGHALLDLDAGVRLHGGTRVGVYLRNALDRHVPVGTLNSQTIGLLGREGGPMLVHLTTPRTLGVSLDVPFR